MTALIAKGRALAQHSRDECLCVEYDHETIDALANALETHANTLNRVRIVMMAFFHEDRLDRSSDGLYNAVADALNGPQPQIPIPETPGYPLSPEIAALRTEDIP